MRARERWVCCGLPVRKAGGSWNIQKALVSFGLLSELPPMQPWQPCHQPCEMPDKVHFPGGCCVLALSLRRGVGGALFNISIRSCPINSGSLSRLKGTAAQAWTSYEAAPDTKKRRGDVVPCLPQLFTVSAAFSATLPLMSLVHPASWQTDGRGDNQTTRPPRVV